MFKPKISGGNLIREILFPILEKLILRLQGLRRRFLSNPMSSDFPIERFVFSEESSNLSQNEYQLALELIQKIKTVIRSRDTSAGRPLVLPASNWNKAKPQTFEWDGTTTNMFTSSDLVLSGDFEVLRKLRLYSQAFTGYQLATLEFASLRPWIRSPLPKNLDQFLGLIAARPDKMSMQIPGIMSRLPKWLWISPPPKFGEIGWMVDGRIMNYDVYSYLSELCLMYENGILNKMKEGGGDKIFRVLEIGGGYGGLAYHLMKIFDNMRYAIVDIPESLLFSSIYLSTLFPKLRNNLIESGQMEYKLPDQPGFTFIPNLFLDQLAPTNEKFDLVINTLSLSEMTKDQVVYYCRKIRELMKPEGVFFDHNLNTHNREIEDLESIMKNNLSGKYFRCRTSILNYPSFRGRARVWRL